MKLIRKSPASRSSNPQWPVIAGFVALFAGALLAVRFEPSPARSTTKGTNLPLDASRHIIAWRHVDGIAEPLAQFRTVFWEPRDTESLRMALQGTTLVHGKTVLEIGTGTGLLAICCLQAGATKVVATDVNPAAVENARYNAALLGFADRLETRLVPLDQPEAFSVIGPVERFDVIVSNPPWENDLPTVIDQYALYDPGFRLLDSLLRDLRHYLRPGGRVVLAYGCREAIQQVQTLARKYRLEVSILDDRPLNELPDIFLPGMLLEVRVPTPNP